MRVPVSGKSGCFRSPCRAVLAWCRLAPEWVSFGERNSEKSLPLLHACTFTFWVPSSLWWSGSCCGRLFWLAVIHFRVLKGISHLRVHWGDHSVKGTGFFTSKFHGHFSSVKNCPEFLTTTNYFYLTFLLSLWPTTIPTAQKNSCVLHRISTDVSTEKLCAENSLFHVYSCPEMTKFKFTYKK